MKYRTFRNLILLGGATALAGLGATCVLLVRSIPSGQTAARTASSATYNSAGARGETAAPGASTNGAVAPATQDGSGQRREEQLILNFLARTPATTNKVQDAFPRERFKVNFYRDDAGPDWTRLKIDTDRDGKDDEKWELQNGQPIKRRVATRDDEQYDREYRWRNSQWVEKN